ncbi:phosphoribosyl-AMP cyclohydrolase [Candidatus Margulisiibacteriota bacterium]
MTDNKNIEESKQILLDFSKLKKVAAVGAVLPVVVQDVATGTVLSICYVNEEALKETLKRKVAVFWSTSRNCLWIKGETSGDYLEIKEVRVNCEQNSLLYLVSLKGQGSCHTKKVDGVSRFSCFYRVIRDGKLFDTEE